MQRPKIFFIHYAGGNRYSFQFIHSYLKDFEIVNLELPGRGIRVREPLIDHFPDAVQDLYLQIIDKITTGRDIIFGHSLGAILSFFVIAKLEKQRIKPKKLIVSGNTGPSSQSFDLKYNLPKNEFKKVLCDLGGMPDEFFAEDDLFTFYEPILRADFKISETIRQQVDTVIQTPITGIIGSKEAGVDLINNWSNYTSGKFDSYILEGDHFFIRSHPEKISQIIKSNYF